MMPKDKAQELVNKIYNQLSSWGNPSYENAKQGALIAVDEIIESNPVEQMTSSFNVRLNTPYWEEVKKEIEKL